MVTGGWIPIRLERGRRYSKCYINLKLLRNFLWQLSQKTERGESKKEKGGN